MNSGKRLKRDLFFYQSHTPLKESLALMQEEKYILKSYAEPKSPPAIAIHMHAEVEQSLTESPAEGGACWRRASWLLNRLPFLGEGQWHC